MSKITISTAEKPLLLHLKNGGKISDDVSHDHLACFVTKALKDDDVKAVVDRHNSSSSDLYLIYRAMIDATMPNPCIEAGGPLLVPTLFFMEPIRFDALLADVNRLTVQKSNMERQMILVDISEVCAKNVWYAHTKARGESRYFTQARSGCLGVILIGIFIVGSGFLLKF